MKKVGILFEKVLLRAKLTMVILMILFLPLSYGQQEEALDTKPQIIDSTSIFPNPPIAFMIKSVPNGVNLNSLNDFYSCYGSSC